MHAAASNSMNLLPPQQRMPHVHAEACSARARGRRMPPFYSGVQLGTKAAGNKVAVLRISHSLSCNLDRAAAAALHCGAVNMELSELFLACEADGSRRRRDGSSRTK